jgi:hypothetical protein
MRTEFIYLATALAVLADAPRAAAQAVGQADVMIQSLTVSRMRPRPTMPATLPRVPAPELPVATPTPVTLAAAGLAIQVTVFSHNDDDAQNVRLNVFFPPETHVTSMPANCTVPTTGGTTNPFATCTVGTLAVQGSQTVAITISMPPSHVVPRVGAFAWAETPDPSTANNHAVQIAP